MPDYKVKITPELDSGRFQKEMKNLTKDRTMKIKIDTYGLEKAARLTDKLSTKLASVSGPTATKLLDYSQTVKEIDTLVDAQNRLQNAISRTQNTSPPAAFGPSEAELNRIRDAGKAWEELSAAVQKYNEISSASPTESGSGRIPSNVIQANAVKNDSTSKSMLDSGMTILSTLSTVTSIGNGLPTLIKNINNKLSTNLD